MSMLALNFILFFDRSLALKFVVQPLSFVIFIFICFFFCSCSCNILQYKISQYTVRKLSMKMMQHLNKEDDNVDCTNEFQGMCVSVSHQVVGSILPTNLWILDASGKKDEPPLGYFRKFWSVFNTHFKPI